MIQPRTVASILPRRPECGVRLEFETKNHGCIHVHAHVHVHVYVCMCMCGVRGGEHT
jgi:hypothetical protein